jgi:hypothetical protein
MSGSAIILLPDRTERTQYNSISFPPAPKAFFQTKKANISAALGGFMVSLVPLTDTRQTRLTSVFEEEGGTYALIGMVGAFHSLSDRL